MVVLVASLTSLKGAEPKQTLANSREKKNKNGPCVLWLAQIFSSPWFTPKGYIYIYISLFSWPTTPETILFAGTNWLVCVFWLPPEH